MNVLAPAAARASLQQRRDEAPRGAYLKNAWYAIAWSDEIGRSLFPRTILDTPIVLFRDTEDRVVALRDRCPHRFAPLHRGTLSGGIVQCPYHGLQFDSAGRCVHNPHGSGVLPKAATVPAYPAVERFMLVWLWMGVPELADESKLPDFSYVDDPALTTIKGMVQGAGHYELYADNIMDLGHAQFLHTGLGAPAFTKGAREVRQEGETVWSNVASLNEELAPLHAAIKQLVGRRLDWWVDVRWNAPANMDLTLYVDEVGGSRQTAKWFDRNFHVITPQTTTSSFYFWALSRNYRVNDTELSLQLKAGLDAAFADEDKPMIVAQQAAMGGEGFWDLHPVLLPCDAGAIRARRVLAKLIAAETQEATGLASPE